ncbi:MAG: transglycosylase domain-containing protein [Clostridiales bacterium]|nr:transglycosylase domain-containing protein [Clostridiales bacterium]
MIGIVAYLGIIYNEVNTEIKAGKIEKTVDSIRERNTYVKKEKIDKLYLKAVVAAEDRRYYSHGAVDIMGFSRAMYNNIISLKLKEGGSSITQQLSKNIFLDQKTELERKIKELFYAIELEKRYSKDDILELYVNTSYFGAGYYGIGPATKGYYDKTPEKLNLNEIAFLAGVPNAPSVYNPYEHYELALQRRNIVLRKMVYNGDITQEEAIIVYNERLNVKERDND